MPGVGSCCMTLSPPSMSVIMTRGTRRCRFSSLRSRRLAALLSCWLWTSTSSTPGRSAVRPKQGIAPVISTTDLVVPATISDRVVTPPATPYSQFASRPAAKLTVRLDQLRRGAFDNIPIAHDRIAYGPCTEFTVNAQADNPLAPAALRPRQLDVSPAREHRGVGCGRAAVSDKWGVSDIRLI